MFQLTFHARVEIAIATILLLASCSGSETPAKFSDAEMDEISDISADVAYDVVLEHEKIRELENRLAEVESRLSAEY
ncbi:hypothetical protein [Porphyrobacter sp. CACIAM 03H1]|uniref:hypothetical protein n=1 Tax=Porphyrobacter sp. CACIAM 03H1 TaxID=2003315 RepID=UPI0012FDB7E7|nr:hypothetical protein [Porphyrobacter sp. CACIAM 03H1]